MSEPTTTTTEVAHEAPAEATGALGTLGINGGMFAAQLVNFLIVLLVLWKWAYKPIVKRLDERSESIEKGLQHAKEADERLAKLESERAEFLKQAKAEAGKVLDEARAEGEVRKLELIEKAKREVERVVLNGKVQLKQEKETMLKEVRKEVIDIAVAAARKIVETGMDDKKSHSLAEEVVRKMT